MRATVDEKLHSTLDRRLTERFGRCQRLENVQTGLGEIRSRPCGVGRPEARPHQRERAAAWERPSAGRSSIRFFPPPDSRYDQRGAAVCRSRPSSSVRPAMLSFSRLANFGWDGSKALDRGSADEIGAARKALAATVRSEAKKISESTSIPPHHSVRADVCSHRRFCLPK